jgi:hypothetical protein
MSTLTVAPPTAAAVDMEVLVKPVAFLSGIAATFAGASIRTCQEATPHALLMSWCGPAPQSSLATASHTHCAGCIVMYAGLATIILAIALAAPRALREIRNRA